MFRIGGSAGTGITSGLDKPRQQYNLAGRVLPTPEGLNKQKKCFHNLKHQRSRSK